MPIYEYACQTCAKHFEVMQKMSDEPLRVCEACGGALEKQWSQTGFQFKGAGWYVTDYANKPKADSSNVDKNNGDKSGAKTADGKNADKSGDKGDNKGGDTKAETKSEAAKSETKSDSSNTASPNTSPSTTTPANAKT